MVITNRNLNLFLKSIYLGFEVRKEGSLEKFVDHILMFSTWMFASRRGDSGREDFLDGGTKNKSTAAFCSIRILTSCSNSHFVEVVFNLLKSSEKLMVTRMMSEERV